MEIGVVTGPPGSLRARVARAALASTRERLEAAGAGHLAARIDAKGRLDTPPAAPGNVRTEPASGGRTTVMWHGSRDDRNVQAYRIIRNGKPIATIPANQTWWTDRKRTSNDVYEVRAIDSAGMVSASGTAPMLVRNAALPGPNGAPLPTAATVTPAEAQAAMAANMLPPQTAPAGAVPQAAPVAGQQATAGATAPVAGSAYATLQQAWQAADAVAPPR